MLSLRGQQSFFTLNFCTSKHHHDVDRALGNVPPGSAYWSGDRKVNATPAVAVCRAEGLLERSELLAGTSTRAPGPHPDSSRCGVQHQHLLLWQPSLGLNVVPEDTSD